MNIKNNQGDELLLVIRKYLVLEWVHCSRRFKKTFIDQANILDGKLCVIDTINELPSTNFRPVDERNQQDFIFLLKSAVESYSGKIDWLLTGRQKTNTSEYNWGVEPAILHKQQIIDEAKKLNLTSKEYLAQKMPELGAVAYDDLVNLAKHVDKYLEKNYLSLKRHS